MGGSGYAASRCAAIASVPGITRSPSLRTGTWPRSPRSITWRRVNGLTGTRVYDRRLKSRQKRLLAIVRPEDVVQRKRHARDLTTPLQRPRVGNTPTEAGRRWVRLMLARASSPDPCPPRAGAATRIRDGAARVDPARRALVQGPPREDRYGSRTERESGRRDRR